MIWRFVALFSPVLWPGVYFKLKPSTPKGALLLNTKEGNEEALLLQPQARRHVIAILGAVDLGIS
jgi:hypothetical protein